MDNSRTKEVLVQRFSDENLRILAERVLVVAGMLLFLVVLAPGIYFLVDQNRQNKQFLESVIPANKFGIVVTEFAEGGNFDESPKGKEISQLFVQNLQRDIWQTSVADIVLIRTWPVTIRSEEAAQELGQRLSADLVVWGWTQGFTDDSLTPIFTFVGSDFNLEATPTPAL